MADYLGKALKVVNGLVSQFEKYFFKENYWIYFLGIIGILFIYMLFFN